MSNSFNYKKFIESLGEQAWKIEVINIFRCFDTDREGALPKDTAIHALSLLGIKDEKLFRGSKDVVTAKSFIEAVETERDRNKSDSMKRWRYIFSLIAGNEPTITKERLREFFAMFGHRPELKFCEDFIDEFDRINMTKTDISIEDWLLFCRIHKVNF